MVKVSAKTTATTSKRTAKKSTPTAREPKRKLFKRGAKILIWLILLALLFSILLNWGFVWARTSYFFNKPDAAAVLKPRATPAGAKEGTWPKDTLAIPTLGINAPVIYETEQNEEAFQKALQNGVVHYPGSSMPGKVGNVFIFGHSSDYAWSGGDYKAVFALLPKIKKGVEIKITDNKGFLYTYLVTDQYVVGPKDVAVLSQETEGKKLLTLQTSYPIGTALKRYIVRAELRQSD